jgi:uncharacterized glyoxalase superfamily protein PhnB
MTTTKERGDMSDPQQQRIVPMLSYEDPGASADWLVRAFGFTERERIGSHVNLELGGALVMLDRPNADYLNPKHHAEVCEHARKSLAAPFVVDGVYVVVDDIEVHLARAMAAGAIILSELEDNTAVGQRQYRAEDPEGHRSMFAQPTGHDVCQ